MKNIDNIPDGALWHSGNELDWNIGDLGVNILELGIPTLTLHSSEIINQGEEDWTSKSCTITGAYFQAMQILQEEVSKNSWKSCLLYAKNVLWWDLWGQYTETWCNQVKKWSNQDRSDKLMYAKIGYWTDEYWYCIKKGMLIGATYCGNASYNKDKKDGVLEWVDFGIPTYGHRINVFFQKDAEKVFDNYAGTSYNVYAVKNLGKLVENEVFYPTFYVFFLESWIGKNTEEIKAEKIKKDLIRLGTMRIATERLIDYLDDLENKESEAIKQIDILVDLSNDDDYILRMKSIKKVIESDFEISMENVGKLIEIQETKLDEIRKIIATYA